ncbi:MAG: RNase adapter RapZ [Bacteroidota bacterium]
MQDLIKIFENRTGEKVVNISPLPQSGSYRKYYRITGKNKKAIGVFNDDKKENIAFLSFTKHFLEQGLSVPEIYAEDPENNIYLIQDLGDITLFSYIVENRKQAQFTDELIDIYKRVIEELIKFQVPAGEKIDYSVCYPRASFDQQSMLWDMSYFKYYFLKLAQIPFDEQNLEDDFHCFSDYLLQADRNYFLYRDFQSRNVMLYNNMPYFIDYQGGRKGALQYDLASLLFDAKADIPQEVRTELLEHYINSINNITSINRTEFIEFFYGYVIIRIMQALGAYGFRGFYEKKEHFLKSIPYAIKNIEWILDSVSLPIELPTLMGVLKQITISDRLKKFDVGKYTESAFKISINSFSYRTGIPEDKSGNGGGFVFDCRANDNPGRYEQYQHLTGKDTEVIEFFSNNDEIGEFLNNIYLLVDQSVEKYKERNFTDLMVNFGCTGGQHRSVYCAEMLAWHLKGKYNIDIVLRHTEQEDLT